MLQIITVLCAVLPFITVTRTTAVSDQDCTKNRLPSLYEQYCCVEDNRGKTFILSDNENRIQYIMCPLGTPASCSEVIFPSCSAVKTYRPTATSGYYNIMLANGTIVTVYCNMDEVCGESGGWMRVGHLNMTDNNATCPPGFLTYDVQGTKSCGKFPPLFCQSVNFTTYDVNYTQVCGRVTGYQKGSPDVFRFNVAGQRGNIDGAYVDGVSITRGSPRKHIWTYGAASRETARVCPCDEGSNAAAEIPSFVGEDYFCETARESIADFFTVYIDDLLWDGEQCGPIQATCCEASQNMPWFKKVLDAPSTDFLELRVCGNRPANEDVGVNFYEFYVK